MVNGTTKGGNMSRGIQMHYSKVSGGRPACQNRRAHVTTAHRDQVTCTKCLARLAKWDAKAVAVAE